MIRAPFFACVTLGNDPAALSASPVPNDLASKNRISIEVLEICGAENGNLILNEPSQDGRFCGQSDSILQ